MKTTTSALPFNKEEIDSDSASVEEVCENFCDSDDSSPADDKEDDDDDEISDEDRKLLQKFGFKKALARYNGVKTDDEDSIEDNNDLLPSQQGMGAVMEEYRRMGVSVEE